MMSPLSARRMLMLAWLVLLGTTVFSELVSGHNLPRPRSFWTGTIAFGMLSMVAMIDPLAPIAALIGLGFDVVGLEEVFSSKAYNTYQTELAKKKTAGQTLA